MEYKVNAGTTLRSFTMLLLILFVVADIVGQPNHQSLVVDIGILTLVVWLVLRIRFISKYRSLKFQEHSLRFAKKTIDAREIQYITLENDECCFKIVFRESLMPVRLSFAKSEEHSITSDLRQWAARNRVPAKIKESGSSQ